MLQCEQLYIGEEYYTLKISVFRFFQIIMILLIFLTCLMNMDSEACGTNNVNCHTDTIYQLCVTVGSKIRFVGNNSTCPSGTVCSETASYA